VLGQYCDTKGISKVIKIKEVNLPAKILYYKLINTHFKRKKVILLKRNLNRGS
jgi:hypothetical protein